MIRKKVNLTRYFELIIELINFIWKKQNLTFNIQNIVYNATKHFQVKSTVTLEWKYIKYFKISKPVNNIYKIFAKIYQMITYISPIYET